ncbi:MAG: glycosyltransferase family 2 protein [Pseudomonadota bacterium]
MSGNVAVIVVNYGTADLAMKAVESVLARSHGGRTVDIHLVDNASPGNDAKKIQEMYEQKGWRDLGVKLWLEGKNHGFGAGNNVVLNSLSLDTSPPEFVFLLNSDAWLENEAIEVLAQTLEMNEQAGGVGAGILHEDGRPAVAAFRFPSIYNEIGRTLGLGFVERLFSKYRTALPPEHSGTVDWVAGASVMFRYRAIEEVGFFDPIYFLYFEEVDLMRNMQKAGWKILYNTEAKVTHIAGVSTKVKTGSYLDTPQPRFFYDSWKNYYLKQHGWTYAASTALVVAIGAMINQVLSTIRRKKTGLPYRFLRDHVKFVVFPLLLKVRSNRSTISPLDSKQ